MALNSSINNKFRSAFEHKCFRLMIDAYQASLSEKLIQLNWNENDISSELHRLVNRNPLRGKWKISTNGEHEIPKDIPKIKGFADRFPRIDIRMTSFVSTYEYEYFFEAKNLRQNNSALKRRYIDTGIDNFISEKYVKGSLIGYLLEGKTMDTIIGINSLLEKDNRSSECLVFTENELLETYYESTHCNGMLKHFIFDFTPLLN